MAEGPSPAPAAGTEAPPSGRLRLRLDEVLGGRTGVQAALALAALRQELESCGDVSEVEHLPGSGRDGGAAMLVTFRDRRSAESAKKALGSACSYEPPQALGSACSYDESQNDSCSANLIPDGFGHLESCEAAAAAGPASATCSTLAPLTRAGSGCDLASSWEAASDSDQESCCGVSPPAATDAHVAALRLEPMYLSAGEGPSAAQEGAAAAAGARAPQPASLRPKFLRGEDGLGLSQLSWGALDSRREWRTDLRLRGLPPRLCERAALLEAVAHLGLRDAVRSVQVPDATRQKACWALLKARSVADVPRIAKAFHGRMFRGSRMPVAVSFSDGTSGLSGGPRPGLPEPRRVACAAAAAGPPAGLEPLAFPPGLPRPAC